MVCPPDVQPASRGAFAQGVVTEALNPKTALLFLAFISQFVGPAGPVFAQFALLGFITTLSTGGVDLLVAFAAEPLSGVLENRRGRRVQRLCREVRSSV